jgi:hypothetical protein
MFKHFIQNIIDIYVCWQIDIETKHSVDRPGYVLASPQLPSIDIVLHNLLTAQNKADVRVALEHDSAIHRCPSC